MRRGFTFFGARDCIILAMRWNSRLETMAGCASSTRTGGAPSLALAPQTTVPAYASLVSTKWTVVLSHFLPLEVGMPSALRVLAMSRVLFPWRAMSKMRRATASAGGFSSSLGRFFGPVLDVDPLVAVGGVGGHPEASGDAASRIPRVTSCARISVIQSRQKTQIHMGRGYAARLKSIGGQPVYRQRKLEGLMGAAVRPACERGA